MSAIVKAAQSAWEMEGAKALRLRVFVQEQGVPPELELDEADAAAFHAVALQDGVVVGTGRLLLDSPTEARIGRMAVEQPLRRQGVGGQVLAFLEGEARRRGIRRITLHAQVYVKSFYASHDYREQGEPFLEAGILHVTMVKEL
ncbi:MAG: GNAT family N-acetyltransferase [Chloroflexi bacterium]|nr:GNAT family N-acetyltransferase [Chloroflexota bacterium]